MELGVESGALRGNLAALVGEVVDGIQESRAERQELSLNHLNDRISRRGFLVQTSLAAGALATIGRAGLADDADWGGFKVGVQIYTFRKFPLERAIKASGDLGFKYIELSRSHLPPTATPEQITAVLNLCKQSGLTPIAYGVERFTKDIDANRKLFDFAKALGVKMLGADPTRDSFDALDKLVAEYDIAIGIHPHGPGGAKLHQWYSAEIIMDAVKNHHPKIGACLDTGHLIRSAQTPFLKKLDPAEQIRIMGSRNFGIHLKDHDNVNKTDVVIGKGMLNVPEVLKALKEVHFTGGLDIEYEAHPDDPTEDVRQCLDVLRTVTKNV